MIISVASGRGLEQCSLSHPNDYLPHPHIVFFSCSFAHQYLYLHILICTSITPVSIAKLQLLRHYGLFIALPPYFICAHCIQIFYCVIDCTFVCPMCNSCCCFCRTNLLYLGQVAVVNDNLFSTSLTGEIKTIGHPDTLAHQR
jgi:hypothetical protein